MSADDGKAVTPDDEAWLNMAEPERVSERAPVECDGVTVRTLSAELAGLLAEAIPSLTVVEDPQSSGVIVYVLRPRS